MKTFEPRSTLSPECIALRALPKSGCLDRKSDLARGNAGFQILNEIGIVRKAELVLAGADFFQINLIGFSYFVSSFRLWNCTRYRSSDHTHAESLGPINLALSELATYRLALGNSLERQQRGG